ncbi:MAG TPA: Uma2 family endonuclease [Pyrinomonadaceae bacterium]|nr:Uma2 family endonuclease [Pyrinomonadaceae bacterium]
MSVDASTISTQKNYPPQVFDGETVDYPETDENVMPEGIKHFLLSVRLASMLLAFFANRDDVKVFGNLMFYYEEGNPEKVISPDLMVCFGLKTMPESVYRLWEEKVVPSVVLELASPTTWFKDVSTKLAVYQKLGVKEYYVYDIEYKFLPEPLIAYRLIDGELVEVEVENGRILSESLNLELVDTGETLRLFNPETDRFLMTMEEMAARLAELENKNDGN